MTIDDIQSFIVHWPNLSDLEVTFCNANEVKRQSELVLLSFGFSTDFLKSQGTIVCPPRYILACDFIYKVYSMIPSRARPVR